MGVFYLLKGLKTQEGKAELMEKSQRLDFPVPLQPSLTFINPKVLSNQSIFFFPHIKHFS